MSRAAPVLVTGCSRGIGKATCERLVGSKRPVYATARNVADLESLARLGCHTLPLDVTDEESCKAAVSEIEMSYGAIGTLINNAGYGVYGPIEQTPVSQLRDEFETNLFGLVRLTQLVLPAMRAARSGRIINVSSVAGKVSFPGGGYYHASKFALEAISDALRFELAPFNIQVVVVEPGPVQTEWANRAASLIPLDESEDGQDPYGAFKMQVAAMLLSRQSGVSRQLHSSSSAVAKVIERAANAKHPRIRYQVGVLSKTLVPLRKWIPDRAFDAMNRRAFHTP